MSNTVTGTGKNVEEAINDGLRQLGVTKDRVETNILQVPDSGIKRIFGKREAIVEVTLIENYVQAAEIFLADLLNAMNVNCKIHTRLEKKTIFINLKGENMGTLIGRRGQTLDAIQHLVNLAINRHSDEYFRVIIDTENYRQKREKTLEDLAEKMAKKVSKLQQRTSLEPMNPSERRIIHTKLQNHDHVITFSEGVEPYRHVVIQPKDEN